MDRDPGNRQRRQWLIEALAAAAALRVAPVARAAIRAASGWITV